MIVTGLIVTLLGYFLISMLTKKTVNGQVVKESFLGFSGFSGAFANLFGDDE